MFLGTFFLP